MRYAGTPLCGDCCARLASLDAAGDAHSTGA
jgi:hypothetical protein